MTDDTKDEDQKRTRRRSEDLLNPTRALRQSAGASGSQRVGNNGPVANPEVSFPDDDGPKADEPTP
jgi:hypothetical protein